MIPIFSLNWLIKTTVDFVLDITPESFLIACDISLACKPIVASPIAPSISVFGTSAATESTITKSTAPLLTSASAISRPCSPLSGWDTISLSISTPKFLAYWGSKACSASIKAAVPPLFWHSAMICNVSVVLPLDSGP